MVPFRFIPILAAPLATLAALACGGEGLVLPETAQLEVVQGDDQVGNAGAPLGTPVIVRLVDAAGDGIPNRAVTWVVSAGGGSAVPATARTEADGFATAQWTLGPSAGPNTLDAVVSGVGAVTFSALASGGAGGGDDGPSANNSTISADPTPIQVGSGTSTIRVTVRDEAGAPISGATVSLSASGSGNTLTQPEGPTGSDGVATGTLRSTVPGTKDVTATVNGSVQINQTAQISVVVAPATRIELVEGDNQSARSGAEVSVRPAVRVTNASGQPVAEVTVTFVVTGGGGSVTGGTQTTNSAGIARVGSWTLGSPGANTLEARAGSLSGSPVVFQATATSPPPPPPPPPPPTAKPHHLVFQVPPHDVDRNAEFTLKVAIVDAAGNVVPLSGIDIYVGIFREGHDHPSNKVVVGERHRDTQNGVSTFNLRITDEGRYRFRALTDELPEFGQGGPQPYLFSGVFEVD